MKSPILLALLAAAPAAQDAPPANEAVASRLAAYMDAMADARGFTGSVLVARDGAPLLRKSYGWASPEHRVPNGPETRFRIGSTTKPMTALAILLLRDRGQLELDDPIGRHLKDAPDAWSGVTIRHLLTHTSGIPSYTSLPDYRDRMREESTVAKMIARFRDLPLEFPPGERFAYNNSGFLLLGALIEEISGRPYERFLGEEVLAPLGLTATGYDHPEELVPNRAQGLRLKPDGSLAPAAFLDMGQPFSAGALYSTVDDLARLDAALRDGKLLSAESHAEMTREHRQNYGLGWFVGERDGRRRVGHGGAINGFSSAFDRYPDEKLCVVVLSNRENMNVDEIATRLADIAFGKAVEPPTRRAEITVAPEVLDRYVGRYRLRPDMVFEVRREGGGLVGEPESQGPAPLFAESPTVFYPKVVDATIEFVVEGDGPASALILRQGGREIRAPRIDHQEKTP